MIVLTETQKNEVIAIRDKYAVKLRESNIWFEPVQYSNTEWILPESILNDKEYKGILKTGLLVELDDYTKTKEKRVITKNEFKKIKHK
jgi:hypothetical protein